MEPIQKKKIEELLSFNRELFDFPVSSTFNPVMNHMPLAKGKLTIVSTRKDDNAIGTSLTVDQFRGHKFNLGKCEK